MRRRQTHLAPALVLVAALALLPGTTWAWGNGGLHTGVFIGHGRPFVSDHAFISHPFVHHHVFIDHGFVPHHVFVAPGFVVVEPVPRARWIPPTWQWNGFGWVLVPGHWVSVW